MGDEVKWAHSLCDFLQEVSCDLLVEKTNDSQCLKDEATFAFLAVVLLHMVAMINEINNFLELFAILHGVNIRQ